MIKDKCYIKKNDKVKVITGKDSGKIGKVLKVNRKSNRLLIENINISKRHKKPDMRNRQGGIVEFEVPVHWSNVMVMCNRCVRPTRIKFQILDDGKKVRKCRKCNEMLDA